VTSDHAEALRLVAEGTPVVLVIPGGDGAQALGRSLAGAPDAGGRERLLAVLVGDPTDPAVVAAAQEMAGELWPWAGPGRAPAGQLRPGLAG
jgi:hypothetical protein